MAKTVRFLKSSQMEFQKVFNRLCETKTSWQVWADFVFMAATAISNAVDQTGPIHDERERRYLSTIKQYSHKEQQLFPQLMAITVEALETEPDQDFLGEMFMALELSNHWKGQFFTPYDVCRMMSEIAIPGVECKEQIERKGWVGINDCACGAGALLIAARNTMMRHGMSQYSALYVAQDIDQVAALMCYIQLSLLGCAGYVVIGDSIVHPATGPLLDPIRTEYNDIWYMPMFYTDVWSWRRVLYRVDRLTQPVMTSAAPVEAAAPQERRQGPSEAIPAPPRVEPRPEAPEPLQVEETGQFRLF